MRYFCMSQAPVGQRSRTAAMQADVLVLHHHPSGFEIGGDIESLVGMRRGRLQPLAQIGFVAVWREGDAIHRQMSTQASHSMHSEVENTVCTSQLRQRCASPSASLTS